MGARVRSRLLVLAAIATVSARAVAEPPPTEEREQCRTSYERGQVERTQGHLRAAVASFRVCSVASCAPFMRSDCARWIDEVSADLPTLIVAVRDSAGRDVPAPRLLVDDELRPELARGAALALDPGEHHLRAEAAGMVPTDMRVLLRVGERARRVDLVLPSAADLPLAPRADEERGPAPRWPLYALGGLAVAGLGTFAGFALAGHSIQEDRAGSCAPGCSDAQVSPIHTDYRVADVGLGIGLASAAAAVVYFLVTPHPTLRSSARATPP